MEVNRINKHAIHPEIKTYLAIILKISTFAITFAGMPPKTTSDSKQSFDTAAFAAIATLLAILMSPYTFAPGPK